MMFGSNKGTNETWKLIPQDSIGVEIGVWKGDSSEKFLQRAKHLHLVDPWKVEAYEDSDEFGNYQAFLNRYSKLVGSSNPPDFQKYYDRVHQQVVDRFRDKPVTIHRCTSIEFFKTPRVVDWVYVDGLHSYEGCLADLKGAKAIIRPGGSIFGDDYSDKKPGVKQAVDHFVKITSLQLNNFHADQFEIKV